MYNLKLKKYRLLNRYTQKNLSTLIDISQNYYSDLELCKFDITVSTIYKVGTCLNMCPKDLIECNCSSCKKKRTILTECNCSCCKEKR